MNLEDVRKLFAYNRWANRQLLEVVGQLSEEELDRDVRASFASMKGTLRHLLWGERSWLRFWEQKSFERDLSDSELQDLPSIQAAWARLEDEQSAFQRTLTEERIAAPFPVAENDYVLGELIQHAVNHSTHHRGQVTLMLRQLGRTPPNTGFRQFLTASRRTQ
jgi:uncharacterized damage-inducible protein DinB